MTTAHDIDWPAVLTDRLTTTHPDMLRELLSTFINTLMGAEADALCGAGYGQRSDNPHQSTQRIRMSKSPIRYPHGLIGFGDPEAATRIALPDWLME